MTDRSEYYQYEREKNQLDITANSGFFSICTVTLQALTRIYPSEKYVSVNWPFQNEWRNKDHVGLNLFELYFNPNKAVDIKCFTRLSTIGMYSIYEDLDFDRVRAYVENYFIPSDIILRKQEELIHKYAIDYETTIGLCYRATNKWFEVAQIQPGYFVEEARQLLAKNSKLRVLVQTDQKQVRDLCVRELGERAFYLTELPVTTSTIGVHHMSEAQKGISNFEHGVCVLAAVNILARCKYVITHTGGVGLWTYLLRGTARNTCQLRPGAPDVFSRFDGEVGIRRATMKRLRKIIINN